MRHFRHSSQVLYDFVRAAKRVPLQKLVVRDVKNAALENVGKEARVSLDCDTGRAVIIEWVLKAGQLNDVTTYHSALLSWQDWGDSEHVWQGWCGLLDTNESVCQKRFTRKSVCPACLHFGQENTDVRTTESRHDLHIAR